MQSKVALVVWSHNHSSSSGCFYSYAVGVLGNVHMTQVATPNFPTRTHVVANILSVSYWTRNHHWSDTHSFLILLLFRCFSIHFSFLFLFVGGTRLWWPFIFIRINCPQNSASMVAHLAINKSRKDLKKYWSLTLIDWPCFYSSSSPLSLFSFDGFRLPPSLLCFPLSTQPHQYHHQPIPSRDSLWSGGLHDQSARWRVVAPKWTSSKALCVNRTATGERFGWIASCRATELDNVHELVIIID